MLIFGIIMAILGFGGVFALRSWRKELKRRHERDAAFAKRAPDYPFDSAMPPQWKQPTTPGRINPVGISEPRSRPSPSTDTTTHSDDSLLNTIIAAEVISAIDSPSYDSSPSSDSSPSFDSSPSSDFTSGGDSGGGGASGDW